MSNYLKHIIKICEWTYYTCWITYKRFSDFQDNSFFIRYWKDSGHWFRGTRKPKGARFFDFFFNFHFGFFQSQFFYPRATVGGWQKRNWCSIRHPKLVNKLYHFGSTFSNFSTRFFYYFNPSQKSGIGGHSCKSDSCNWMALDVPKRIALVGQVEYSRLSRENKSPGLGQWRSRRCQLSVWMLLSKYRVKSTREKVAKSTQVELWMLCYLCRGLDVIKRISF